MKRLILTSVALFGLTNSSFAGFLDDNLIEGHNFLSPNPPMPFKDIKSTKTQKGRSDLSNRTLGIAVSDQSADSDTRRVHPKLRPQYPTVGPVVHSDRHHHFPTPFSGEIPSGSACAPHSLAPILNGDLSDHLQSFAFIIQGTERGAKSPLSLKPQYWLFPDTPATSPYTQQATVRWTVVPGAEGNVQPDGEPAPTVVSIHPIGGGNPNVSEDFLILSEDSLQLSGIQPDVSTDFYDLVAEDTSNRAVLTYRWMLNDQDLRALAPAIQAARTFQNLINRMRSLPGFENRVAELEQFIGITPRAAAPARPAPVAQPVAQNNDATPFDKLGLHVLKVIDKALI